LKKIPIFDVKDLLFRKLQHHLYYFRHAPQRFFSTDINHQAAALSTVVAISKTPVN
jgi:hypothetical protein